MEALLYLRMRVIRPPFDPRTLAPIPGPPASSRFRRRSPFCARPSQSPFSMRENPRTNRELRAPVRPRSCPKRSRALPGAAPPLPAPLPSNSPRAPPTGYRQTEAKPAATAIHPKGYITGTLRIRGQMSIFPNPSPGSGSEPPYSPPPAPPPAPPSAPPPGAPAYYAPPPQYYAPPPPPPAPASSGLGWKLGVLAGLVIALIAANVYLYMQLDKVKKDLTAGQ